MDPTVFAVGSDDLIFKTSALAGLQKKKRRWFNSLVNQDHDRVHLRFGVPIAKLDQITDIMGFE